MSRSIRLCVMHRPQPARHSCPAFGRRSRSAGPADVRRPLRVGDPARRQGRTLRTLWCRAAPGDHAKCGQVLPVRAAVCRPCHLRAATKCRTCGGKSPDRRSYRSSGHLRQIGLARSIGRVRQRLQPSPSFRREVLPVYPGSEARCGGRQASAACRPSVACEVANRRAARRPRLPPLSWWSASSRRAAPSPARAPARSRRAGCYRPGAKRNVCSGSTMARICTMQPSPLGQRQGRTRRVQRSPVTASRSPPTFSMPGMPPLTMRVL